MHESSGLNKKDIFQSLFKSELFLSTSVLISGSVIAQVIPVLLQPLLRRSAPAEVFGAYSVYLSLIGILIIISSFKYELAIILPKRDKEAANVFLLSFILIAIFNVILFGIIILWRYQISVFLNLPAGYSHYLFFVPIGTFLFSTYQGINYWLIRKKSYKQISVNKFIRRSIEGGTQITLKALKFPGFLLTGDIIGHVANVYYGYIQIIKNGFRFNYLSLKKLKYVAFKYIDYPKYNLMPSLMSACSSLLPAILINKFFSLDNAGYIDLSRMLLSLPVALISISISSVLLERMSGKFKSKLSVKKELSYILLFVIGIGILEILIIIVAGEKLFMALFGRQWMYSGILAKTLVWSYALNFIVSSFYSLFLSFNKIKLLSIWQIIYFIAIISLVFFKNDTFDHFVRIYVYFEASCMIVMAVFLIMIVTEYENSLKIDNTKYD